MTDTIKADLERLFPTGCGDHFLAPARQALLLNVLSLWADLNTETAYRQVSFVSVSVSVSCRFSGGPTYSLALAFAAASKNYSFTSRPTRFAGLAAFALKCNSEEVVKAERLLFSRVYENAHVALVSRNCSCVLELLAEITSIFSGKSPF